LPPGHAGGVPIEAATVPAHESGGLVRPSIALHSAELLDRVERNGVKVVLVE
jgi:hypothetical protein